MNKDQEAMKRKEKEKIRLLQTIYKKIIRTT